MFNTPPWVFTVVNVLWLFTECQSQSSLNCDGGLLHYMLSHIYWWNKVVNQVRDLSLNNILPTWFTADAFRCFTFQCQDAFCVVCCSNHPKWHWKVTNLSVTFGQLVVLLLVFVFLQMSTPVCKIRLCDCVYTCVCAWQREWEKSAWMLFSFYFFIQVNNEACWSQCQHKV